MHGENHLVVHAGHVILSSMRTLILPGKGIKAVPGLIAESGCGCMTGGQNGAADAAAAAAEDVGTAVAEVSAL